VPATSQTPSTSCARTSPICVGPSLDGLPKEHMSDAYHHFREGQERLRKGMAAQATVPLEKAKRLEPGKASIREALGIAYCRRARWKEAEEEFRTIVEELAPTDDYAHYALGRALEQQGRAAEAHGH